MGSKNFKYHGPSAKNQYIASMVVNIVSFGYGFSLGWPSTAFFWLSSSESSPWDSPLTIEQSGWLGGILCLGAVVSLPLFNLLLERYSINFSIYLASASLLLSWGLTLLAGQVKSNNMGFILLMTARSASGITGGVTSITCTQYVFEIAQMHLRGALGVIFVMAINSGILFAYIICPYMSYNLSAILGIVIIVIFFVLFPFMPKTPSFLMARGKKQHAYKSLLWLRSNDKNYAKNELENIENVPILEKGQFKDLFANRASRQGMLIGCIICINSQLCGIYAILTFVGFIFREASGENSSITPYSSSILIGSLLTLFSYISSILVERLGRKILLICSNFVMGLCLTILGLFFFLKNYMGLNLEEYFYVPILSLSLYIVFFAVGLGPLTFVVLSEIFPQEIRERAYFFGMEVFWITSFLVGKFFNNLADVLGWSGCYWFFALFCYLGGIFIIFTLPETKNKSIDEIIQILGKENIR